MPDSQLDQAEARLVARARRGDREAFGDLYERHLAGLYRYVFYRVGDAHEAEDVTELVFLKAWQALDRYQPGGAPFRAWLYRIAHNTLIDRARTLRPPGDLNDDHADPNSEASPEQITAQREQRQTLAEALRQLEPAQQQVLLLRFVSELSHAETAQVMNRTEGAVRVLQHRALAALRRLLEGRLNETVA
jgi:RNA polymerase sigma-70 factor (ECF subfamily)